ncbi:ABC transporter substrate-binding protein [Polymorphobacter fuscus]|uniref:ABC transporter substrate-binding protein n=2 Tax=Sandarakinorhabdus fusca TaxID=1439888 RepID=A0A7C9GT28_9SPHN|nr:ABC transporter substrate-binding protein [Polymorphobacter fuscus]MQT16218.1 ABC transporter substrate-binding protein [Polymorphobacter fuscus]
MLAAAADAGSIDRRSFLQHASWLGAAVPLGACAAAPGPSNDRLRFVCAVQAISDPALSAWVEASNLYRNVLEFLTEVDADNIVRPALAESWRPSADLRTWTFTLKPGVRWSNGQPLTAADIGHNFDRWLAPGSKSVNRTALAAITGFERLDDRRFALHLARPLCTLAEQLYSPTCAIVHPGFDGTRWTDGPIGTGPYRLTDFQVGRQARFDRRDDYWGPPALLRQIDVIDLGPDVATHVAALAAGQVDMLYRIGVSELDLVERLPAARLLRHPSAMTICMRMKIDQAPFDDIRVRRAIQLAADNAAMLRLGHRGFGILADHTHVSALQPDHGSLAPQARDVREARRLLAAAGFSSGLDLSLVLGNTTGRWEQDVAQILQQNLAEAGIRLALKVLPPTEYWSVWDKVPFGLTSWGHRPLGIMTLDLGYRGGSSWNETGFADPQFDTLLDTAMAVVDPVARRGVMAQAQQRLRDAAVIMQPFWPEKFTAVSPRIRGHVLHPADYFRLERVWLA